MRCSDGIEVDWKHSGATVTSLTSTVVKRLREGNACSIAVAHSQLTASQLANLYNGAQYPYRLAQAGKTILRFNLEPYCQSIGQLKLRNTLARGRARGWTRDQFIKELLKCL